MLFIPRKRRLRLVLCHALGLLLFVIVGMNALQGEARAGITNNSDQEQTTGAIESQIRVDLRKLFYEQIDSFFRTLLLETENVSSRVDVSHAVKSLNRAERSALAEGWKKFVSVALVPHFLRVEQFEQQRSEQNAKEIDRLVEREYREVSSKILVALVQEQEIQALLNQVVEQQRSFDRSSGNAALDQHVKSVRTINTAAIEARKKIIDRVIDSPRVPSGVFRAFSEWKTRLRQNHHRRGIEKGGLNYRNALVFELLTREYWPKAAADHAHMLEPGCDEITKS